MKVGWICVENSKTGNIGDNYLWIFGSWLINLFYTSSIPRVRNVYICIYIMMNPGTGKLGTNGPGNEQLVRYPLLFYHQ